MSGGGVEGSERSEVDGLGGLHGGEGAAGQGAQPNLGALLATWVPWIASQIWIASGVVEADAQRCCCCFFSSRALRAATYMSSDAGGVTCSALISPLPSSVPLPGGLSAAQRPTTGEGRWEGRRLCASTEEGEGSEAPPGELEGLKLEGLAQLASPSAAFTFTLAG